MWQDKPKMWCAVIGPTLKGHSQDYIILYSVNNLCFRWYSPRQPVKETLIESCMFKLHDHPPMLIVSVSHRHTQTQTHTRTHRQTDRHTHPPTHPHTRTHIHTHTHTSTRLLTWNHRIRAESELAMHNTSHWVHTWLNTCMPELTVLSISGEKTMKKSPGLFQNRPTVWKLERARPEELWRAVSP